MYRLQKRNLFTLLPGNAIILSFNKYLTDKPKQRGLENVLPAIGSSPPMYLPRMQYIAVCYCFANMLL